MTMKCQIPSKVKRLLVAILFFMAERTKPKVSFDISFKWQVVSQAGGVSSMLCCMWTMTTDRVNLVAKVLYFYLDVQLRWCLVLVLYFFELHYDLRLRSTCVHEILYPSMKYRNNYEQVFVLINMIISISKLILWDIWNVSLSLK